MLDKVQIWSTLRNDTQINVAYAEPLSANEEGLVLNCPEWLANEEQQDSNADGLGDACTHEEKTLRDNWSKPSRRAVLFSAKSAQRRNHLRNLPLAGLESI